MTLNLEVLFPEINIPQRIRLYFLLSLYDSFVTLNLILTFGEDKAEEEVATFFPYHSREKNIYSTGRGGNFYPYP